MKKKYGMIDLKLYKNIEEIFIWTIEVDSLTGIYIINLFIHLVSPLERGDFDDKFSRAIC